MQTRKSRIYLISMVLCQAILFTRYVLMARVLGPQDIGLANIIILVWFLFELLTDIGADRYMIVSPDGDDPAVQRTSHALNVARGVIVAVLLVCSAGLVSRLYSAPQLFWPLTALALYPIIAGFIHNDIRRKQRELDFRPEAICNFSCEAAALIATAIALFALHSVFAIVIGLIARAITVTVTSHLLAERRYSLGIDRSVLRAMLIFAVPLSLNGLLVYAANQGDRLMIGSIVSVHALGLYSSTLLLIYSPTALIARYLTTISIPTIANAATGSELPRAVHDLGLQFALLALAMGLGFAVVAPFGVAILYGPAFALPFMLTAMIGITQVMRFSQNWLSMTFLSLKKPRNTLILNIARIALIASCWLIFARGGSLTRAVGAILGGEALSMILGVVWLNLTLKIRLSRSVIDVMVVIAAPLILSIGINYLVDGVPTMGIVGAALAVFIVGAWTALRWQNARRQLRVLTAI